MRFLFLLTEGSAFKNIFYQIIILLNHNYVSLTNKMAFRNLLLLNLNKTAIDKLHLTAIDKFIKVNIMQLTLFVMHFIGSRNVQF